MSDRSQKTKEQWLDVGKALAEQGQYEEAILAYHQAFRLDPNNAEAYLLTSFALAHLGRDQEAGEFMQIACHLAPRLKALYESWLQHNQNR